MASAYGLYLDQAGITDRATVIIDAGGTVRFVESVTPGGERDINEIAAKCEEIDRAYDGEAHAPPTGEGLTQSGALYIKSNCGFSLRALNARKNLHLEDMIPVYNVSESEEARKELEASAGKTTAPCLIVKSQNPIFESDEIVQNLARQVTGF